MNTRYKVIALASSLAILAGCATQNSTDSAQLESQLRDSAELQSQLRKAQTMAEKEAAEAERLRAQLNARSGGSSAGSGDLLPPNGKPGHCYARVLIPGQYTTGSEKVLAHAASERIEIVPARYEYVDKSVMVKEATTRLEVIPATYKTATDRVMVEPEKKEIREIAAEYETLSETILVKPAYTTWKKGRGPMERLDASTGEIMCLVEVPAEYKTVSKKMVKTPARTEEEVIPAKYETVKRTVVDTPARTREVSVPAEYATVKVRKLLSESSTKKVEIPAEYRTVQTQKLVADSRLEWREILCETNTTPGMVSRLQAVLNDKGYDAGSVDGILGNQTLGAVKKYQLDNNLASGQLTIKVLDDLGVSL